MQVVSNGGEIGMKHKLIIALALVLQPVIKMCVSGRGALPRARLHKNNNQQFVHPDRN